MNEVFNLKYKHKLQKHEKRKEYSTILWTSRTFKTHTPANPG